MRDGAGGKQGGLSDLLKQLARRIAEEDGVVPLRPGEIRPDGYYMTDIFTIGRKPIDLSKKPLKPTDKR